MSGNFFNVGNALESLEAAKNAQAEQTFQTTMEDIQDTANEKLTLFGDIEKGGGTLLGGIAGTKAVISGIKSLKTKLSDLKNKGKSLEEKDGEGELDNAADNAEEGTDGLTDGLTENLENLTSNITDNLGNATDAVSNVVSNIGGTAQNLVSNATNTIQDGVSNLSNGMDGIVSSGRTMLNNLVSSGQTNTGPSEVEMTDLGGRTEDLPSTEGTGESLGQNQFHISQADDPTSNSPFLRDTRTNEPAEQEEQLETGPEEDTREDFPDLPDDDVVEDPAAEFGGTQPEGIAGITTDTTIEGANIPAVAAETGLEVGAEVGEEAAGAALDATGIGAIIGIPLQILGLLGAGASVAAGIFGSDAASSKETTDTQAAQSAEAAAKAKPAEVAGRIAPEIQTAAQRAVGGY